jgi:hypothetical protein
MKKIIKTGLFIVGLTTRLLVSVQGQTPCLCKLHIDNTYQIAPMTLAGSDTDVGVAPLYENDNATTPAIALPFNFCFYGQNYDSVFISNNGIISFVQPIHAFIDSSQHFPLGADTVMIAPFFADANTNNNSGLVYYKITSSYMVVIWDSVRFAGIDVDGWNYFQMIISNGTDPIVPFGNNVSFCYPVMQWACSESSGGFSGYGGTPAFVGINKGDGATYAQISTFSLPGTLYEGPFSPYNGIDWLDWESFTFNTCVTGNVIPPVIYNIDTAPNPTTLYICPCDTTPMQVARRGLDSLSHQPCDTVTMTAAFICAVNGQNASVSYTCTGPLNIYAVDTSTVNIIDSITVVAIPVYTDTGTTILKLIATDSVSHTQSTVIYTLVITTDCLNPPHDTSSGIAETEFKDGFSVYPNPANKNLTVKLEGTLSNTTARIFDVLGKEVISTGLINSKSELDISGLARGVYFLQLLRDGTPLTVKKIIIQ